MRSCLRQRAPAWDAPDRNGRAIGHSSSLRSIHVAPRRENTGLAALTILTKLFRYNSGRSGAGSGDGTLPPVPAIPSTQLPSPMSQRGKAYFGGSLRVHFFACLLAWCTLGAVAEAQGSQPSPTPRPNTCLCINGALNGAPASVRIRNQTSGVRTLISQPDARRRDDCARVLVAEKR